jgi:hypothetical protein
MRLASMTSAIMLIVPSFSVAQSGRNGSANPDPLEAYISCRYGAGLNVVSALRMQGEGLRSRTVATATGERTVSIIDGYRLMLSMSLWQTRSLPSAVTTR